MELRATIQRAPRTAGFTLLEVLVALAVVALGMMAVIQAVADSASNGSYLRDKTIAHWIAMNRLAEVRLDPNPPKVDETSDEVEMAGREWRWTMEVQQTAVDSIRRIDIYVRPAEAPEDSSIASITGFYGTAIAPAGTVPVPMWQGEPGGGNPRDGGKRDDDDGDDDGDRDGEQPEPPPDGPPEDGDPGPMPEPEPDPEPPVEPGTGE